MEYDFRGLNGIEQVEAYNEYLKVFQGVRLLPRFSSPWINPEEYAKKLGWSDIVKWFSSLNDKQKTTVLNTAYQIMAETVTIPKLVQVLTDKNGVRLGAERMKTMDAESVYKAVEKALVSLSTEDVLPEIIAFDEGLSMTEVAIQEKATLKQSILSAIKRRLSSDK